MQANKTPKFASLGMDQRSTGQPNTFYHLQNFGWREDLACWDSEVGWEPLRPWSQSRVYNSREFNHVHSVFPWTTNQGRVEYILQERIAASSSLTSLSLFYEYADGTQVVLDTDRQAPSYSDAGTQYVPFGRFLLTLNGSDRMLKFWGDKLVTPFGFTTAPPAPQLEGVDPSRLVPESSSNASVDNNNELNDQGIGIALYPHLHTEKSEWITDSTVEYVLASGATLTTLPSLGHPSVKSYFGLGYTDQGERNTFSYKVSFVSDTGSESCLSEPATVSWVIPVKYDSVEGDAEIAPDTGANGENFNPFGIKYGVLVSYLPTGPDNVVARRLYRTKNKRDGLTGAGDEYFLVAEIRDNCTTQHIDFIPDNELVTRAPSIAEAGILAPSYKYGAAWDNRLWLAGGSGTDSTVVFSESGKPEQFGGFSFFDVGVREGGPIFGLHPFNNALLVFREFSIDIVYRSASGYQCTTLHPAIGTTATNTIQSVPGVGVLFLSYDGVYAVSGGLDGGGTPHVQKVSAPIQKWMNRISRQALPRATATYSRKWQEYWVHFPTDGSKVANRGAVLHTQLGQWSVRGPVESTEAHLWDFNRLAVDREGNVLIAPNLWANNLDLPVLSDQYKRGNIGVQIWSRSGIYGVFLPESEITELENGNRYAAIETEQVPSYLISAWIPFDTKAQGTSVQLQAYQSYSEPVTFHTLWDQRHRLDDDHRSTTALMHPDEFDSNDADPVWGTATVTNVATYNESEIVNHRLVQMRFDIHTEKKESIAWGFKGTERLLFQAWALRFNPSHRQTLRSDAGSE